VYCSVLQYVLYFFTAPWPRNFESCSSLMYSPVVSLAGVLQCVAVCCSVLQCVAVCHSVLQCVICRFTALRPHVF